MFKKYIIIYYIMEYYDFPLNRDEFIKKRDEIIKKLNFNDSNEEEKKLLFELDLLEKYKKLMSDKKFFGFDKI